MPIGSCTAHFQPRLYLSCQVAEEPEDSDKRSALRFLGVWLRHRVVGGMIVKLLRMRTFLGLRWRGNFGRSAGGCDTNEVQVQRPRGHSEQLKRLGCGFLIGHTPVILWTSKGYFHGDVGRPWTRQIENLAVFVRGRDSLSGGPWIRLGRLTHTTQAAAVLPQCASTAPSAPLGRRQALARLTTH